MPLTLGRKTSTNTDTAYHPTARSYPVPITYARSPDPELQSQGRGRETPEQDFDLERGAYSHEDLRSTLRPRYRGYNPGDSFALPVRPPTRSRLGLDSHDPAAPSQPRGTWEPRELGKDRGIIEAAPALDESYEQRPDKYQSRQARNKSPRTLSTISDPLHGEADNSLLSFANDPFQPQASDPQILSETSPFQPRSLRSRNSFETTTTLSFLGGSQNHFNWLPPQSPSGWSFCQTGVLVRDFSRFKMDEATQPSTIPTSKPRNGRDDIANLSKSDRSDIVCILLPGSPAACKAVELIAASTPQHILQNRWLHENPSFLDEIIARSDYRPGQEPEQPDSMVTDKGANTGQSTPTLDIALRLTSKLLYPWLGFTFGRAPDKCDMLICNRTPYTKKVSGAHFRIYVNANGSLMCRDTSTNGTWVDGHCLEQKSGPTAFGPQITLHNGSSIEVLLRDATEFMRFFVHIPERHGESEVYGRKLDAYIGYVEQLGRQNREEANAQTQGIPATMPPVPMLPFDHLLQCGKRSVHANRNLVAGTEPFHHGMQWSGGDTYKVTGYIGKGAFAAVYKLARRHDGEVFAAKEIRKSSLARKGVLDRKVDQEINIMKRLHHPNIVQYIGHHETGEYFYIIMELVHHGDLQSCLSGGQPRFQEHLCQAVASQICQALRYLHDNNITHRDIKPDNILIASHDPYIFKLSDFGLSKVVADEETFLKSFCGTLLYCAPEVYDGYGRAKARKRLRPLRGSFVAKQSKEPYTTAVDTWSLAAVLYHLLCGSPPFTGTALNQGEDMLHVIMNTSVDYVRLRLGGVSEPAIDFVKRMLVVEPASRPSDSECLDHPWLSQKTWSEGSTTNLEILLQTQRQAQLPEDERTRSTERADEDDLNAFASQLSIADQRSRYEELYGQQRLEDIEEMEAMGQSKRKREGAEEEDFDHGPSLGEYNDDDFLSIQPGQQQPRMLFGEVTRSVLQSSGVLDWQAKTALDVTSQGNYDPTASESRYEGASQLSSTDFPHAQDSSLPIDSQSEAYVDSAAPSLLGAEAMVGQLKMDSAMVDASSQNSDAHVTSPKTEASKERTEELEAGGITSTASSQGLYSATPPPSSKRKQPLASTHEATGTIAKSKKHDADPIEFLSSKRSKTATNKPNDQPQTHPAATSHAARIETTSTTAANPRNTTAVRQTSSFATPSKPNTRSSSSSTTKARRSHTKPQPLLATLTTVPASVAFPPIQIIKRTTSFGRMPNNDYIWPDPLDVRVAKHAFTITFRPTPSPNPASSADSAAATAAAAAADDDNNNISATITTGTTKHIWVNDVQVTQSSKDNRPLYGYLRTGDTVTVFHPLPGAKGEGKEAEMLKFAVEVHVGKGNGAREAGEVFEVLEGTTEEGEKAKSMKRSQSGKKGPKGKDAVAGKKEPKGVGSGGPSAKALADVVVGGAAAAAGGEEKKPLGKKE
ncbi:MAG: hypothetical protein Q9185_000933 [Variospora sp. 1 TL-2023]